MSITVTRDFIIKDDETGEEVVLGTYSNGNIKLIVPNDTLKPDIFEALLEEMKKMDV